MSCSEFGEGTTKPDAANDAYIACSAANQSTSGEPNGRPLLSQSSYASFATNSCRSSPRKSVVSSRGCCLSDGRDFSGIVVPPRFGSAGVQSQPRSHRLMNRYNPSDVMPCPSIAENFKVHRQGDASYHRMKGASSGTEAPTCCGTMRGV